MRCSLFTAIGAKKNALPLCALILALNGCASSAALTSGRTGGLAPAPRTPGAIVTHDWSCVSGGATVTQHGQWLHLPASEAGELLLWIERAETACR